MISEILLTAALTWGSEEIDTQDPLLGVVNADIQSQIVSLDYKGFVLESQSMSIKPEVGQHYSMDDVSVGYNWGWGQITTDGENLAAGRVVVPVWQDKVYGISTLIMRKDGVDRATIGLGYQFTDNISMNASYGESRYDNGFDSTFTTLTLVIRY